MRKAAGIAPSTLTKMKKDEDVSVLEERVSKSFTEAIEAIKTKEEKEAAFEAVKAAA